MLSDSLFLEISLSKSHAVVQRSHQDTSLSDPKTAGEDMVPQIYVRVQWNKKSLSKNEDKVMTGIVCIYWRWITPRVTQKDIHKYTCFEQYTHSLYYQIMAANENRFTEFYRQYPFLTASQREMEDGIISRVYQQLVNVQDKCGPEQGRKKLISCKLLKWQS